MISGTFITFSTYSSSALSSLALVGTFDITVSSSVLCAIEAVCLASAAEEGPSPNSGTMAGSIYRGGWVKTFIFFPFGALAVVEAAGAEAIPFLFFP
jgi:hypothetical protein